MKQPEVLRTLNEKFTSGNGIEVERTTITRDEYLELRRLHSLNQELVEALEEMVSQFDQFNLLSCEERAINEARAALTKARKTK